MSEIKLIIEDKHVLSFLEFLKTLNYVSIGEVTPRLARPDIVKDKKKKLSPDDPALKAVRPHRKGVKVEDLIREQGYQGTDWNRVEQLATDMAIEEPTEELLAQLTA
ncbi:MAG: hypothetical protein MUC59_16245 [Saprospiraceae bacterium]|jgi:hypothetical protein|nr:hypothetical protein [Saprospiraceae bacterium]